MQTENTTDLGIPEAAPTTIQTEGFDATIVDAQITEVTSDAVTFKFGGDHIATLIAHEVKDTSFKVGESLEVYIDRFKDQDDKTTVSKTMADKLRLWERFENGAESREIFNGEVLAIVKGGISVDVGIRAFMPASHAELKNSRDLSHLLGQKLDVQVIDFDKKRGTVVVSRRKLLEKVRKEERAETLAKLNEGEVIAGTIERFTNFGAFVDIGGLDGLLHLNDMGWARVDDPHTLFKLGQEIKVKVLKVDHSNGKVALGYKQLTQDPWNDVTDKYEIKSKHAGKVTSLTKYGAFVELSPGIEGLIHVSEMSWTKRNITPSDLLKRGDEISVMVLDIDQEGRRISLGLKQTTENPWVSFKERHEEGEKVKGPIKSMTDFGLFIQVEEGFDGLMHFSDYSWNERLDNPEEVFKLGDEVEVVILDVDIEKQRLGLGIKQLSGDPWAKLLKESPKGSLIKGKVTRTTDFGAFIEIAEGIEGLCHVSELSVERVSKVTDAVKEGAEVEVKILDIDRRSRKISLSIKAAKDDSGDFKAYKKEENVKNKEFSNTLGAALQGSIKDTEN